MSAESWKLDKDLCRCCHSEGVFKNLAEPHSNENQVEIYCDMMQQCLDITINPVEGPLYGVTYTICQECIQRLRDACSFKRQVTLCEQRFYELYNRNGIKSTPVCDVEVKIEISDSDHDDMMQGIPLIDENDDDRLDANYENGDTDNKDENDAEIKPEEEEEEAKKARPKKARPKKGRPKAKVKQRRQVKKVGRPRKTAAPAPVDVKDVKGKKPQADYYRVVADALACNLCDRKFASQPLVSQHYRFVHLKRRPRERKCPHCEKKVPGYLRAYHLEEEHGIPAPTCGVCQKRFRFPCHVLQHQKKVHMGEKSVTCEVCDKGFFDNFSLKSHMLTHSSNRRFRCDICDQGFRWKNNLKDHILIHMGERRHVCKTCGKGFVQKSSLKQHEMRNHY